MWTTDRNHTMCTEFYLLQQNAFHWPSWLSATRISVQRHASSLSLRRILQKLWHSAPAQPRLHQVHPNPIIVLAFVIPAAQASLCSAGNPTSKGTAQGTHTGDGGGRKRCRFLALVLSHCKNTCYVDWHSQHSSSFYRPLLRRTDS